MLLEPAGIEGMVTSRIICTDYTKYKGGTVIARSKNMTVEQLYVGKTGSRRTITGWDHLPGVQAAQHRGNDQQAHHQCGTQDELHFREIRTLSR
jgi:hypothetical protein